VIPSTIMLINDRWSANRNAQAAEAVADWFLSVDGQNAIVDAWMHSVRSNFRRLPTGALRTADILANSMPVNWNNVYRDKDTIYKLFENEVAAKR